MVNPVQNTLILLIRHSLIIFFVELSKIVHLSIGHILVNWCGISQICVNQVCTRDQLLALRGLAILQFKQQN